MNANLGHDACVGSGQRERRGMHEEWTDFLMVFVSDVCGVRGLQAVGVVWPQGAGTVLRLLCTGCACRRVR